MAELPTFSVTPHPENPHHALLLSLDKAEWEYMEDHDAVLLRLEPVALSIIGEKNDERLLHLLRMKLTQHLYFLRQTDQIHPVVWPPGGWMLTENEKLRNDARKLEFISRWPWLKE